MVILSVIVLLLCLGLLENIRELRTFRVTHYEVDTDKIENIQNEIKIVFLSDLHNYEYGANNDTLIESIRNECPDMILIGGDMLIGKKGNQTETTEKFVISLTSIAPVYYANGNHEQRIKEDKKKYGSQYSQYKKRLADSGIIFLENEHSTIQKYNMAIYGLEIPRYLYRKGKRQVYEIQDMIAKIGEAKERSFCVLLAHNPVYMKTYLKWNPDLVLSGHLHGGMIRLPIIGGVVTPQFGLFPKYSGEHRKNKSQSVIVSKGLGVHTIKIRLFNPAEVVVIHIKKRS